MDHIQRPVTTQTAEPAAIECAALDAFPLSFSQERLYFLTQLEPDSPLYNMAAAVSLSGDLDIAAFRIGIDSIGQRHESLRTTFVPVRARPMQVIASNFNVPMSIIDLTALPEAGREIELVRISQAEAQRTFDLAVGPLLRTQIVKLDKREYLLFLTMHHLIGDGWSRGVFLTELRELYDSVLETRPARLPELRIQYAAYASWQREWLQGEVLEKLLDYWRNQLHGLGATLDLPVDRVRPAIRSSKGRRHTFFLPEELAERLRRIGSQNGATLFMIVLAAFKALLYRYGGQNDVAVGTPIANRNQRDIEDLIGFFVNTLVLRTDISGHPTFTESIRRVREVALGAYAHQELPFEKLVEVLQPQRDLGVTPFFQVMFVFQNAPMPPLRLRDLELSIVDMDTGTSKFDLILEITELNKELKGVFEFSTDLFDLSTIERMIGHLGVILESITDEPAQSISVLPILSAVEYKEIVDTWNNTGKDHRAPKECIHELFANQARLTPDAIAVIAEEGTLSYRELDERANQIAHYLLTLGVTADNPVAIVMNRCLDMVICMLGILKSGGAYVPLDPSYPPERLKYMAEDALARILLTVSSYSHVAGDGNWIQICVDEKEREIATYSRADIAGGACGQNLMYVIYTSGSTGRPKGVMLEHRGIRNRMLAMQDEYGLTADDRLLQKTTFSFDVSVWEIFFPLMNGAATVLARDGGQQDAGYLIELIKRENVTMLHFIPAMLQVMLSQEDIETCSSLRYVVCGGDYLPRELQKKFYKNLDAGLYNHYGPTEGSIEATRWSCYSEDDMANAPIGMPITNISVYVVDEKINILPIGAAGELTIGRIAVARGYLNRPDLTAERFIPDPYDDTPGLRIYKTGDRAKYIDNGAIEFLGRIDGQVKIRGYRVELGEIQAILSEHEKVREALIVAREGVGGSKRLIAYLIPAEGKDLNEADLRRYLNCRLPEYMVPTHYFFLEELPLNPNGKVDYRALPDPNPASAADRLFVRPRNYTEVCMARIWSEVLDITPISVADNFFNLGGHSLLVTQVCSRIRQLLRAEIPLREVFLRPTVASLAEEVERLSRETRELSRPVLKVVPRNAPLPLSFAQTRMWFLHQLEPGIGLYSIAAAIRLNGNFDDKAFQRGLERIVSRHETLRTRFVEHDGIPVQLMEPTATVRIDKEDLRGTDRRDEKAMIIAREEIRRPFDLSKGKLLRAKLLRLDDLDHIAIITIHHIVGDGWSMGIFVKELGEFYEAELQGKEPALKDLTLQYADYAVWQREWLQGEVLEDQLQYWKEQLKGVANDLPLPTDRIRPTVRTHNGSRCPLFVDRDRTEQLARLSVEHQATVFMLLMAAFKLLLSRYSGQDDIVVGTPIANRNLEETEQLIGFFVNTLVLRSNVQGQAPFLELLATEKEAALGAYAHQDLPFEKLVEEVEPERDLSLTPLFQVMFVLQNAPMPAFQLSGLKVTPFEIEAGTAIFDIMLELTEFDGTIKGALEYNTDLYDQSTIERMGCHYLRILEEVINDPARRVDQIDILTEIEKKQLIEQLEISDTEYGPEATLNQLIEATAADSGDAIAVVHHSHHLSYQALNRRANQLAHFLIERGIGPEVGVGICLERSAAMMEAMLAVLKAGGMYIPLDPAYPDDRLKHMLADSGASLILTEEKQKQHLGLRGNRFASIEEIREKTLNYPEQDAGPRAVARNLAYVIYTSGSTGEPKGVEIEHHSAVGLLRWAKEEYSDDEMDVVLASTSICFDLSIYEIFGTLSRGGKAVLVKDALELAQDGGKEALRTVNTVPSAIKELVRMGGIPRSVDVVNLAGEALTRDVVEAVYGVGVNKVINLYGPTEDTTYSTLERVEPGLSGEPTIGRGIRNKRAYVLDRAGEPAPIGVKGEIYVSGEGLSRGYRGKAALTADRFRPCAYGRHAGSRMYQTGDLGKRRSDGKIEYAGRKDHQVKVRGYRIEVGEIEAALMSDLDITEAVVVANDDTRVGRQLVAYVVGKDGQQIEMQRVRELLRKRVPEYMMPAAYVLMGELPLTTTGKIDRKRLAEAAIKRDDRSEKEGPSNEIEGMIAFMWEEVIGATNIGIHHNFFELGGHSLIATRILSRINAILGVDIPLRTFFEHPTIARLASFILENPESRAKAEAAAAILFSSVDSSADECEESIEGDALPAS